MLFRSEGTAPSGGGTSGGGSSGGGTSGGGTDGGSATVAQLLARASDAYDRAQAALKAGNLGEYQRLTDEVGRLLKQARDQSGGSGSSTTTTTRPGTTSTTVGRTTASASR